MKILACGKSTLIPAFLCLGLLQSVPAQAQASHVAGEERAPSPALPVTPAAGEEAETAVASPETPAASGTEQGRLPEEIRVIGEIPVNVLANLVSEAEDHMYALFNDLNDDEGNFYDIQCKMEATTGTLIKQKTCRPAFMDQAELQEAEAFLQGRSTINRDSMIAFYTRRLREKFQELMEENPDFDQAVREYTALNAALEERKRTSFGKEKD